MEKEKLIITGSSGLVGSRIVDLLSPYFDFHGLGTKEKPTHFGHQNLTEYTKCSILDPKKLEEVIATTSATTIIHLAALVDLDIAEQTRHLGENSLWWQVNVEGTRNVAELARKYNKKIIYASSDYIFEGDNGPYCEDDRVVDDPSKFCFYAETKLAGERVISEICEDWLSVRFSIPFRSYFPYKTDRARTVVEKFIKGEDAVYFADQTISPCLIDDLATFYKFLIERSDIKGIIHFAGQFDTPPSPYSFAKEIIERFYQKGSEVKSGSFQKYRISPEGRSKAPRPLRAGLYSTRLAGLGFRIPTLLEEIENFYNQCLLIN